MIRVMVVSKHADVLDGLVTILRLVEPIDVIATATTLPDAARTARAEGPDVLLVDLEMPEEAGYAVIRQLSGLCPHIIALTAYESPEVAAAALRDGACRVVVKGVDWNEMVRIIQATASGSRS